MSHENRGYALKKGQGTQIDFRSTKMTVKVSGQSDGHYSLIEMTHVPNVGPALHIHPIGAEAFYVLEGEYTIHCDQQEYIARPNDFVFIPKGTPHSYHSGEDGGKVLVIAPAGLEGYFTRVAELLSIGPITWELEQEIARQHGQEFLDNLKHWGQ